MEKFVLGCLLAMGGVLIMFLGTVLATFFGGVAGWVVGWAFPYVTDTLRELFSVTLTNFQVGATLGFFGSAFRSIQTSS